MDLFHSTNRTPFRLEAHEGDLKHTLILGITGSSAAPIGIDDPSIDAIKGHDGNIFAMLTKDEQAPDPHAS